MSEEQTEDIPFTATLAYRPATANDMPFVYHKWKQIAFNLVDHALLGAPPGAKLSSGKFNAIFNELQTKLLSVSNILIAHDLEDPNSCVGFLVYQRDNGATYLHYIFVKQTFWRLGVGRSLLAQIGIDLNHPDPNVLYTANSKLFDWWTPPFKYQPFNELPILAKLIEQALKRKTVKAEQS